MVCQSMLGISRKNYYLCEENHHLKMTWGVYARNQPEELLLMRRK